MGKNTKEWRIDQGVLHFNGILERLVLRFIKSSVSQKIKNKVEVPQNMMEDVEEVASADAVFEARMKRIKELVKSDPKAAIPQLREILKGRKVNEPLSIYQERAAFELMIAYRMANDADALIGLLNEMKQSFDFFTKAKRENFVKNVFDQLSLISGSDEKQIALCEEYIAYLKEQKRMFLRQRFEAKLAALLAKKGEYQEALRMVVGLISEVKKVDDKLLLVELYLIESRIHFAVDNISKARSSLTAAKTNANSVYIGVTLQSQIDLQAGVINAHERDFRTSFSYFYEANEGFVTRSDDENGLLSLQYMLVSKIMNEQANEVPVIVNQKNAQRYASHPTVVALMNVGATVKDKSLEKFSKSLESPTCVDLLRNKLIRKSFKELENELLEKNIGKIIEPYSRVEIERIAQLMKMEEDKIMTKLTQMILDKKLRGIIDQGVGELILYDEPLSDKTYEDSLQLLENMGSVVNNLIRRAKSLHTQ